GARHVHVGSAGDPLPRHHRPRLPAVGQRLPPPRGLVPVLRGVDREAVRWRPRRGGRADLPRQCRPDLRNHRLMGGILDRYRLDGKVALVTGAGKGIGSGIAVALAEAGAHVAVTARTKEDIEAVAKQVRELGREAVAVPGDVTDHSLLPGLVEETVSALGGLD